MSRRLSGRPSAARGGIFPSCSLNRSNDFRNQLSFAHGVPLPISTPACIPTDSGWPRVLRRFAAVGRSRAVFAAAMPVPEAAVNENSGFVFRQKYID